MTFSPNGYGLYDMAGNVWEWCSDWYRPDYYAACAQKGLLINPEGPADSYDPQEPTVPKRVVRGGSFLCTDQYCCSGFRVSARMKTSQDSVRNIQDSDVWFLLSEMVFSNRCDLDNLYLIFQDIKEWTITVQFIESVPVPS